ncbi:Wall-associated receptor kinase-like 2 [Morella rubra]|uniref:Wall-associated receptor kinase-like 2 n=1 Tax=Morella rubra TaxID=262757 RepID=A0A6A1WZ65_9ROSI|nr:Wall-associated receptor kinase-like 2 [Morella rubra]
MAELLTSKKALSLDEPKKDKNLANCLISAIKEDCLLQILDDQIVKEDNIEELKDVANLAKRCLTIRGEDGPTMKEVAMELEGLKSLEKHPWGKTDLYTEEKTAGSTMGLSRKLLQFAWVGVLLSVMAAYRAKLADFGTSRSVDIDQTHLTTLVYGTFGYLDPEYFQSSQFTEKSDVYSFGVVLAELLTGEKAISSTRTLETKSLATHIIHAIEENKLFGILDHQVLMEGKEEEIIAVANLTKRCLDLIGKNRPDMKEVIMELEAFQMLQKPSNLEQKYEVDEDDEI